VIIYLTRGSHDFTFVSQGIIIPIKCNLVLKLSHSAPRERKTSSNKIQVGQVDGRHRMKAAFGKQLLDRLFLRSPAMEPQLTRFVGKGG
jgi:hypothetical protein